jgi:hypothetical protein
VAAALGIEEREMFDEDLIPSAPEPMEPHHEKLLAVLDDAADKIHARARALTWEQKDRSDEWMRDFQAKAAELVGTMTEAESKRYAAKSEAEFRAICEPYLAAVEAMAHYRVWITGLSAGLRKHKRTEDRDRIVAAYIPECNSYGERALKVAGRLSGDLDSVRQRVAAELRECVERGERRLLTAKG